MSKLVRGSRALAQSAKTAPAPPRPASVGETGAGGLVEVAGKTKGPALGPAMRRFLGLPEAPRGDPAKKIFMHLKLLHRQNPRNGRLVNFANYHSKLKSTFERTDQVKMQELAKIVSDFAKLR